MATVTSLTADRMLAIEAASVVDGDVVGDDLILTRQDGSQINAGVVRGPAGPTGPVGTDLSVVSERDILSVGNENQIRAGREITATDFTRMGLSAPRGLWNLSNTNDSSGNGRNLTNKGAVAFGSGITGVAASSARFNNDATQILYISDTGGSDPFRIKTGTIGCWVRITKRGVGQTIVSKRGVSSGQWGWQLSITVGNSLIFGCSSTGSDYLYTYGKSDVADGRWHFVVAVNDACVVKLYVDGILDGYGRCPGPMYGPAQPFNIGGFAADASNTTYEPVAGFVDEAFVTSQILSEQQIRNLYCAKIPHTLGATPKRASVNVRRRKRGASFMTSDFSTTPVRLYNFSAGSIVDEGSNGQALSSSGTTTSVPGADGSDANAYKLSNAGDGQFISTDTGLPSALGSRSYGLWFCQSSAGANQAMISWGSGAGTASNALWIDINGHISARTPSGGGVDIIGPHVADGDWHFAVVVEENAPFDGVKRRLYVDGVYRVGDATLGSITLAGANRFRIGSWADGIGDSYNMFDGIVDAVFVCNYAMGYEEVAELFAKAGQPLGVSPKNPGDHVEEMSSTDLYCIFDSLSSADQVDMVVA